jgi:deoxyribodipyrimidine photolyase
VYVFDPRHFILTPWGNPKTGNYRAQFLLDSVLDLKANLRGMGSDLIIKFGHPEGVLPGSAVLLIIVFDWSHCSAKYTSCVVHNSEV